MTGLTWARIRTVIRKRGAASFLVAALVVGVVVGLGAALLVTLIELVGDQAIRLREGESDWSGLGRWATLITLPLGLMAAYLINKRWGPGVESGGGESRWRSGGNVHAQPLHRGSRRRRIRSSRRRHMTFSTLDPGAFAVVGMAATFATVARAPLTSIIIVFELTQNYGLVLPLMLATSLATAIADRLYPATGYTLPLVKRVIFLPSSEDINLLDTVTVGNVMSWSGPPLDPSFSTLEATDIFAESAHHGLPVVTDGKLEGSMTLSDLARAGGPSETTPAGEVMTKKPITVFPGIPVSAALARMAALDVGRLPVVAEDDPLRFAGMFRRESVVRAYHHALGATQARSLYRERHRIRTQPGANFFEVPIPPLSAVHGRRVREFYWPGGATLVSVRRGDRVIVPHGDTITAFGSGDPRIELAQLLKPAPADDPGSVR